MVDIIFHATETGFPGVVELERGGAARLRYHTGHIRDGLAIFAMGKTPAVILSTLSAGVATRMVPVVMGWMLVNSQALNELCICSATEVNERIARLKKLPPSL